MKLLILLLKTFFKYEKIDKNSLSFMVISENSYDF